MNTQTRTPPQVVVYPEDDGKPLAENTLQFECIASTRMGLDDMFADDPHVFVAADLLWYPVEGDNTIRQAPDVMVAFGRPKGFRSSYRQWEEGGIAPQVVFEILSPGNRPGEMMNKALFYQRYGVEEYFLFDPEDGLLEGWENRDGQFRQLAQMQDWVSPRLKVRFTVVGTDLQLYMPDGRRFATYDELVRQGRQLEIAKQLAEHERQRAEQEKQRAEQEKQRAEQAEQQAEEQKRRANDLQAELERLRAELQQRGGAAPG